MILLHTILTRPYVFVFFIVFLFLGIRSRGLFRTLVFLVLGYLIAWLSEASSIRTGFPYGWYFYKYQNLQGDWLNWGVPVWDSLSYTFLCFAGLCLAESLFLYPLSQPIGCHRLLRDQAIKNSPLSTIIKVAVISALFVTLLDVVIDPVAHMGDRWFLGDIYYYPSPGFYFDVPLNNFLGWLLVSFVINGLNLLFERIYLRKKSQLIPFKAPDSFSPIDTYGGVFLYFGIFIFNWLITLWLHEWKLALADVFWIAFPAFLLYRKLASSIDPHALSHRK